MAKLLKRPRVARKLEAYKARVIALLHVMQRAEKCSGHGPRLLILAAQVDNYRTLWLALGKF